jgi:hypothetical protein
MANGMTSLISRLVVVNDDALGDQLQDSLPFGDAGGLQPRADAVTQIWNFAIAFVLAAVLNVSSIHVARALRVQPMIVNDLEQITNNLKCTRRFGGPTFADRLRTPPSV